MTCSIVLLDERAVLSAGGADARRFLHGVVTADIETLGEGEARYAALLTPQGKILFDFFVLAEGVRFLVDCAAADADALLQRLALYRLRSKVELAREVELAVAAVWEGSPPAAEGVSAFADPRLAGFGHRLIGPPAILAPLANAAAGAYHSHRIAAGLADSTADIGSGEFFPHEANLDQLGGISFSKGCYIGQEVVSRMHHRGTARARIVPVDIEGTAAPGEAVAAGGRPLGRLLSRADGRGLAYLRLDRLEEARRRGETVIAGAAVVIMRRPAWARWAMPGGTDEET